MVWVQDMLGVAASYQVGELHDHLNPAQGEENY